MRSFKIYFFSLLLCLGITWQLNAQNNCPFYPQIVPIHEECLGQSGVQFFLLNENGTDTIEVDPANGKPYDSLIYDLSLIKFRYQKLNDPTDTATKSSTYSRLYMTPGQYSVSVTAQCYTGLPGADEYRALGQRVNIELESHYDVPRVSVLNLATSKYSAGNLPTYPCDATGRIQLRIEGGRFPYYITMVNTETMDTIRIDTIWHQQYNGNDESSYNYKYNYTYENLPAGKYRFYFRDDCGYTDNAPSLSWIVEDAVIPQMTQIEYYSNASGSNTGEERCIFQFIASRFSAGDNNDYMREIYRDKLLYRVCYGSLDTSAWKPYPMNNLYHTSNTDLTWYNGNLLYDTASHLTNYCELDGQYITFQFGMMTCNGLQINSFYSGVFNAKAYLSYSSQNEVLGYNGTYYDSCGFYVPNVHEYVSYLYGYQNNNTWMYMRPNPTSETWTVRLLQAPLHWALYDLDAADPTVPIKEHTSNSNGSDSWYIYKGELENIYGQLPAAGMEKRFRLSVSDNNGCSLSSENWVYLYDRTDTFHRTFNMPRNYFPFSWLDDDHSSECCSELSHMRIYEYNEDYSSVMVNPIPELYKLQRDGAQYKLIQSPRGNKYNFTATYHYATDSWEVVKDSVTNNAEVLPFVEDYEYRWRWGITIQDYCLPEGYYKFVYTNGCEVDTFYRYHSSNQTQVTFEEPAFTTEQICDNLNITLTEGKVIQQHVGTVNWGTDPTQPEELGNENELPTYFRVMDGPVGGYPDGDYTVGQNILLTMPGTYTLRMYCPNYGDWYCGETAYFDTTITYVGGTVAFDYAIAYVCEADSTIGFFYSQALDGVAPYTYTLYRQANMEGGVIDQNTTGSFKGMDNVRVGDVLSLSVEDACGRSYFINITVVDFSQSTLAWFNSGLQTEETCEGAQIDVYVSSYDENFTYHWTGPNGFSATTQVGHIFIKRGYEGGFYAVELGVPGCSKPLRDTVELHVIRSPKVESPASQEVCPGETINLAYTPTYGNGTVHYTIGQEVNSEVTFHEMHGNVNDIGNIPFTAEANAKFWIQSVVDNECQYRIPEDTIEVNLKQMATACDVSADDVTVCYGSDANLTASSSAMNTPYTVRWYTDPYGQHQVMEAVIDDPSAVSGFPTGNLFADTTLYVTVQDAAHCETYANAVQSWLNFDEGITHMDCGQSIRLFDDGGLYEDYASDAMTTHVFTSNPGNAITLNFNSFHTQQMGDVLYVYAGTSSNQDSLLAAISGDNLPEPVTSHSGNMTLVFVANQSVEYEGWDAVVGCSALPAKVDVTVLEDLAVKVSIDPELPRYGNDVTVRARAIGGQASQYKYTWYESDDNQNWTPAGEDITNDTVNVHVVPNIQDSKYVKVEVVDQSVNACQGVVDSVVYLEVANIKLALLMKTTDNKICQGDVPVSLIVRNEREETARDVKVMLHLPEGMSIGNSQDSLVTIGNVALNEEKSVTVYVRNDRHVSAEMEQIVKAQIWSCEQGDPEVAYQNWDWSGNPNEADEFQLELRLLPSFDVSQPSALSVNTPAICFGSDATFVATSDLNLPQYYTWYTDAGLTNAMWRDTVDGVTLLTSSHPAPSVSSLNPVYYVAVENNEYCPAYTRVDYQIKLQYNPTDTLLMHNDYIQVTNDDHIILWDDGGINGGSNSYYSPNRVYAMQFASVDGSPLTIYFDGDYSNNYLNGNSRIELFDGDDELIPRMNIFRYDAMRGQAATAYTGKLRVKFTSDENAYYGFSAHVFTNTRAAVAPAVVTFKQPLDTSAIITEDAAVCYGQDGYLTATAAIAYPQTHTWYDWNMNYLNTYEVQANDGKSSHPVYGVIENRTYYVTVSNATECPVDVSNNGRTESREVWLDADHHAGNTLVIPSETIYFYDEGGPDGRINTVHNYTHTFTALQGNLNVYFSSCMNLQESDTLYVYDGENTTAPLLAKRAGGSCNSHTYTSTGRSVTFEVVGFGTNVDGWRIQLWTTNPQSAMAQAKASVKLGVPESITTEPEITVCSGSEVTLEATSDLTVPQEFVWYNSNRVEIGRSPVTTQSESGHLTVYPPIEPEYYVTVTNADNCPIESSNTPQDASGLVKIKVNYMDPVINRNIHVTNAQVCPGETFTLTAITEDGTDKHFSWYDADYNYLQDGGTSTSSTFTRTATDSAVYYVNAVEPGQCGILPANFGRLLFNASMDGDTTFLAAGEAMPFYDAGGPDNFYETPGADWVHTFVAPVGKRVTLKMNDYYSACGHMLEIYDGMDLNNPLRTFSCCCYSDEIVPSNSRYLTVRWVIDHDENSFGYRGWDALVGVKDDNGQMSENNDRLAHATVTLKPSIAPASTITANGAEVCYGSDATLTATSTIDYPQYYTWYSSDRRTSWGDTVETAQDGGSSWTLPHAEEGTYYVSVSNASYCPASSIIPSHHQKVLMNGQGSDSYTLTGDKTIDFYDAGDINGDYQDCWNGYYHFNAPEGSRIHVHFNNIQLEPNNNAYLEILMRKEDGNYEYKYIYGTAIDTDFVSESNYVRFYFWNSCNSVTAPGWDGYIYAVMPVSTENLATAQVSFIEPTFSQQVTTSDVEACYGSEVTLTASNGGGTSHYAWFDENYNLLKDTIGETGTLDVTVLGNNTYYVNASSVSQCPVIPPYYGAFIFDGSKNNRTTVLSTGESLPFYDAGGPSANYNTPGANWTHTFRAPAGKQVTLRLNSFKTASGHYLDIYDGTLNNHTRSWSYSGDYGTNRNDVITSDGRELTVRWRIENNANANNFNFYGWEGEIGVLDDNDVMTLIHPDMPAAYVTVKTPIAPTEIITVGALACYGDSVTLFASSPSSTYPQVYTWYAPNRMDTLKQELVENSTMQSHLNVVATGEETYYVSLYTADNCPVARPLHTHYREISNPQTIQLSAVDSVGFFDYGGKNGDYPGGRYYTSYYDFNAIENATIKLHFNRIELANNSGIVIYNLNDNSQIDYFTGSHIDKDYLINSNKIRVEFNNYSAEPAFGWDAYVYAIEPIVDTLLAAVNVKLKLVDPNDIDVNDVVVCYGDSATLSATANIMYPQYYTWYTPDRMTEWKDTIYSAAEVSEWKVLPTSEESYYVIVSCDTTCPIGDNVPANREELLMSYGGNYNIPTDKVLDIYDDGGENGNYSRTCTTEVYGFSAPSNSYIRIHFNNVDLGDNGDSYINLSYNDASTGEYKYITINGRESDWDRVVNTSQISMNVTTGCDGNTYPGWDGYFYIISPKDPADLAKVDVRFAVPTFSSNVTTADVEACYGNTVTLSASNGSGVSRYAWYDENKNLLKDTIGEYGTLNVLVTNNVTYYVSASSAGECPILPPHYGEFWFDHSKNGGTTILTEGEAIPFYDEGGPNANYNTPDAYWTHTFVAPAGKQVTLKMDYYYSAGGHYLEVFDGTGTNNNLRTFNACCYYNETVTSNTGALTVRWKIEYNNNSFDYTGWIAQIGVLDNNNEMEVASQPDLTAARVTIKTPVVASQITTTDGAGCYGYSATLQASSNLSDYPQTFYWYDANYNPVDTDTVYSANDHAEYLVGNTTNTTTYYVTVGNETECPAISFNNISNNSQNIDLRQQYNGKTTVLTQNGVIFNDYDGRYEDIQTTADFTHTFTALQGKIKIKFNGCFMLCSSDSLYVFDGTDINGNLLGKWGGDDCSYPEVISSSNSITVLFKGSDCGSNGWRSVVTAINDMEDYFASATAYVRIGAPESITAQDVVICYGDDAVLEASSDIAYDQTFTWYGPDRTTVLDVQPISSGNSTYTVPQPTEEGTYYVMVTNDTTCPIPSSNYEDIYMSEDEKHYTLTPGTIVNFYDAGGPNDNYLECGKHYYYFEAEPGSTIHFHLDYIQLDDYGNAYMELYNESNWSYIAGFSGSQTNVDYEIQTSRLRVYFNNCSNPTYSGWQGTISVEGTNPVDPANLKAIHVSFMDPVITDNIQVNDQEACYGETVTLAVNNVDPNKQYVWFDDAYNVVGSGVTLSVEVTENTTYYVNANEPGECSIVQPGYNGVLSAAHVNLKAPVAPSNIATNSPVEVCYGSEATLTASANISYPQTYTWYGPDRTVPLYEKTITSGQCNYTFTPEENTYYVSVTNSENCSPVASIHNEEVTVLMDGSNNSHTLAEHQLIHFYDAGGVDNNYNDCWSGYNYFYAPEGSRLRLHFNNIALEDNNDTYLRLYMRNENGNWEYQYIYGNVSDTDFVAATGSSIEVYFSNYCNSETAAGWDAYIYALKPLNTDELAAVQVNFSEPSFSQNVSTNDVEVCYGNTVTLTATNGNGTSNYAWYDENMNFLGVNQTGTYNVTAMGNATYYVNASAANECPVMPPHYGEFWFDESKNGDTTYLTEGTAISFYDAGGPNAYYNTPGAYWTHYFIAPQGKQVTLKLNNFRTSCDHQLYVFDGFPADYSPSSFSCYQGQINQTIHCSTGVLTVQWNCNSYNNSSYPGWEGEIGVLDANDEMRLMSQPDLAAAHVSIKAPIDPSAITTTDGEGCYGNSATLTATSTLSGTQHFYWYDGIEPAFDETVNAGEASRFAINSVTGTKTYYVTVGNGEECPVFVPETLGTTRWINANLDAEHNGTTTIVMPNDQIDFYDEGGSGSFTPHSYTRTFKALQGQLYVENYDYVSLPDGDVLYIYDGEDDSTEPIAQWSGSSYPSTSFTTTGSSVTFKLVGHDQCCWDGWHAVIRVANPNPAPYMAEATVTLKAPLGPNEITTTNGEACYGQSATLTAKADIANVSYPQYFTWYNEELTAIHFDTLYNDSEVSSYTVPQVTGHNDYYVTMSNADNCSVVFTKEILLNEGANGGTTILDGQSNYRFCDEGGSAGYYNYNNGWSGTRTHTFTNPSGQVFVTFDRDMDFYDNDRLYIYDGTSENDVLLYTVTRDVISSMPLTFQSNTNSLTFKFEHYSWSDNKGWNALVATTPMAPNQREIRFNHNMNNQTTLVNSGEVVNFYDEGGANSYFCLDGSKDGSITHTFTAASGKLQIAFKNYMYLDAIRMLIYDGPDVNNDNLIKEYNYYDSWNSDNTPVFTSSGSSITIKLQMDYNWNTCPEGWRAEISTTIPDLAIASTSVKVVDPSTIVTTNDTVCYGSEATLTASSDIAVPQYYFWYGPDRMEIIKKDTVNQQGGHSSLTVLTGMEETYYVTVTNDTTCPFVEPIHNNVKNVVVAENFQTSSIYVELASNDSVVFYDAGGPDGNIDFRNNNNSSCWDQNVYFTAEDGSYIHVHLDYLDGGSSDARFTIYDEENGREIAYFRKSAIDKDYVIKSTRVRLSFSNDCDRKSFPGWLGSVYAVSPRDANELAEARVRFKEPVGPGTIRTENPFEVCYGSEVTLTASSTLDADQYFVWYAEDRVNILKRDTVHTAEQNSMLTVTPDEDHTTYYVAVTNAANCPIIENIHTHYREVLIGQSYQLQPYDSIGFFDDGGRNNNYAVNSSSRSSYITAEDGSYIRIHFDTISLARRAYLRVRDEENNQVIVNFSGPIDTANLDFLVESDRVYFYFDNDKSSLTAMGWNAYIYAITPHSEDELVEVNVEFMDPTIADQNDVTVTEVEACYGETVTLTASVETIEPQRFVWYDESSNLLKDEVRTGNSSLTVVATEEAFYYVNVSSPEECPVLPPYESIDNFALPYGHVILKAGVPGTEITTTNDEVCFGGEAVLTATSSIAFPQYYTWFAPDRITILKQETVTAGGHSTFTVTADEETDYYVAISNDENCPIVDQIHNHYVEILMDGSRSSYELADNDSVGFFDAGGKTGNYWTDWSGDFNFRADQGSFIRIHFDTVQLARNAYIQIYEGDNYNSSVAYITGSRGNLDTIIENNRVRIYFYGYSNSSAPGWEAYVYALNPRDEDELASAHVSFMQPSINNNLITTTNAEGCYSATDTVKAVSTLTENQYFAWYDNEMNLLKQEVIPSGEYSELPVEILANTTYYVNVSTENECPVLPPHYGEFWFNASVNGGTTNLAEGEGVPFYDEAGPDGIYNTPDADWTHTFVAPAGKQVTLLINDYYTSCGHQLEIYDGTTTSNQLRSYSCCCYSNETITSNTGALTIRWRVWDNSFDYRGWDGLIGVVDDHGSMSTNSFDMAEATVTVTSPTWNLPLTTTNDTVCYGDAAYLTASSTIDYPQYYLWYAPDARTILLRDTIDGVIKTESEFNAPYYYHYQDQTYYVAIGNAENCPPVLVTENEPRTVLLNAAAHNQTTVLAENESAKFYDAGGLNDSYHDHNSDYTHTFQATHGTLMVQFRDNNMDIYRYDTLYVYDSDHADETRLIGKVINDWDDDIDQRVMNYDNLRYYSTGQYLTFRFQQGPNNNWYSGWNATIMPYNLESELATAEVNVKISSVPEMAVTTVSDTVCYGSAATVSASADLQYPQYYTWYNSQMEVLQQDTLFDASETESVLNLPAQYRNETYYAYIYSDTVSCIMDMEAMPKQYSELYLNTSMDGGTTVVHPYDSIGFFSDGTLQGSNNRSLDMDYYFTAESGLIQIHFDELELTYETWMEFIDDGYDIDFIEIGENTYHDVTITSLSNTLHIDLDSKSSDRATAYWRGTVTNINVVNTAVLSKMAQANVAVEINNSVNTVTTTNDTVCIGSPAILTASSDIAYPQYYIWYNDNLSSILFEDTITSGSSNFYIPGQVGNATYRAMVSDDTTCTLRPVKIHDNFREIVFDANMAGKTIFVGATDSVAIYDDGGKDGDYIVPEDERIFIMKVETYPGATLNFRIPMAQLYEADDDLELVIAEPDEYGNIGEGSIGMMLMGSINDEVSYTTSGNEAFVAWIMYGNDLLPMAGFEMVVTSDLHPENHLAEAQVIMKNNLPMDYNALTNATSTVICQGDNAELEATSNLTENPQYFLWYSNDLSRVIGADTVYSGSVSHVSIPNLMQDTLLYVAVGTDEVCPAYPMEHKLISEIKLNTLTNAHTTYLSAVDSVLFYDDGGKNNRYTFQNGYLYRTFKASSGHVVFNLHELSITDCDDENFLGVLDGEFDIQNVDEDSIRAMYYAEEIPAGDSIIISTGNTLSIIFVSDHMHEDEPNNGWFASIYTTEQVNSDMSVLTPAEVTVNPSYQFDVYDTTNASHTPYTTPDNMFRNIDVTAEGEYVIDSVFQTALNCDSTYTLHLMVLPPTVQDIIIASNSNSWTYDGWIHTEETYTVVYGLDTLTANAGSDGKVFTMPGTGDLLTITPDAGVEVVYYTPTPVPNSFTYVLENEGEYPSVTTDTGTLAITPIPTEIVITANSASKYYDGTPLTNDGFTYTPADILVEGDTLVAEITGTITEIGDSLNRVVSYQVLRNVNFNRRGLASYTQDVTNCYTFSLPANGTLSVVDTFVVSCEATNGGRICPGTNDGTATITIEGGKFVSPNRYTYSIVGENTGYNNSGNSDGEISLNSLSPDNYNVVATDALGLTATATFSIVERPLITSAVQFDCPADIDTLIAHGGCNLVLTDLGTPNFVAPTGLDMADVTIYNDAPADNIYSVGETTVTWVVKGMCGDSLTCEQHVRVAFPTCPDAIDYHGIHYPSVRLGAGCKCWTTENLKSTQYSDGRPIDEVMSYYSEQYPDTAYNVSVFGHLYNWYAAADTMRYGSVDSVETAYRTGNRIQGICPEGWFLPSDEDFDDLNMYSTNDLRSTTYWLNGGSNTNASGFNSLPGGMYNCSTSRYENIMGDAYYWTCHPVYDMATGAMIDFVCERITFPISTRCNGFSIRCVLDEH